MSLLIKKEIVEIIDESIFGYQKLTNESEKIIPIYHSPKLNLTPADSFSLMIILTSLILSQNSRAYFSDSIG